jgi:hypothetical protein
MSAALDRETLQEETSCFPTTSSRRPITQKGSARKKSRDGRSFKTAIATTDVATGFKAPIRAKLVTPPIFSPYRVQKDARAYPPIPNSATKIVSFLRGGGNSARTNARLRKMRPEIVHRIEI